MKSHWGQSSIVCFDYIVLVEWRVTIYTSNVTNAGTDSRIYLTLNNGDIKSEELKLDDSRNNYERGAIDSLSIVNVM